jgi:ABC-2 type transport system permease protein
VTAATIAGNFAAEAKKIPAFLRRDFLVAWSYRLGFFTDVVGLVTQVITFYFLGMLVDPAQLPEYGGTRATYLEFVSIGLAVGMFVLVALSRVATAVRGEQMMGTLESVLVTPTNSSTVQIGSVSFDVLYVPIRTAIFLALIAVTFGLDMSPGGILPAVLVLVALIPFVWGLGVLSAAAIVTFRRGAGIVGIGATLVGLVSGAVFPLALLPGWAQAIGEANPIAIAIDGMREVLLGGEGWSAAVHDALVLAPASIASLAVGLFAFRLALHRERRRGTLGLY